MNRCVQVPERLFYGTMPKDVVHLWYALANSAFSPTTSYALAYKSGISHETVLQYLTMLDAAGLAHSHRQDGATVWVALPTWALRSEG